MGEIKDNGLVAVSPKHYVRLAAEYCHLVQRAPSHDYTVRTIVKRKAGDMPLMSAEIIIAGADTRQQYPLADKYPLHFRKTYFPGRLHGDPKVEYDRHARASELLGLPPPIGHTPRTFRSCFLPGKPYSRLTPFGAEPEESNIRLAQELPTASAVGLWKMAGEAYEQLTTLHGAGLVHGDAELHNLIVCPAPLQLLLIDFELSAARKDEDDPAWAAKCRGDLLPLLKEAVFLQCALGHQSGPLADGAWAEMDNLFKAPDRFRRQIGEQAGMGG